MNIKITRIDGGLHVIPAPPYLTKYLKYQHRGMERKHYKLVPTYVERLLHQPDGEGGVYTLQGFFEDICKLIHKHNDTFTVDDQRTLMPRIDWSAVKALGPKEYQIEALIRGLNRGLINSGIWLATGGWGKTYAQAFTYAAFNKLNTILAIPSKQVFIQTYNKFVKLFPKKHIGRVGDGNDDISTDITISTFKSLPKCAIEKCEMMLVDEIQGCTGDVIQDVITSIRPRRIYGYTATDEGMFNKAEKIIKGLFGERLICIPYDEALEAGAVVPGLVYFIETPDVVITASSFEGVFSQGVKKCKPRNQLIAKVCTLTPKDWPVLVFVDHIQDHLIELYKYMPTGTKYVHRETSKTKIGTYALSTKEQDAVVKDFCDNKFCHLIATDAFRAGVDIPHLRVVVQAASGCSEVEVIQEALRGSRILYSHDQERLGITEPKTHFVLIDFMDNHHDTLHGLALKRMELYRKQGWAIRIVKSPEEIDFYDYQNKKL